MKKLLPLFLAATALSFGAAAPTPGGSVGVALNPSNAYSFLNINAQGALLLAQLGPGGSPPTPAGSVGIALDPSNNFAFLHVDSTGGLIVSGAAVTGPITTSGLTESTATMLGRTSAGTGAIQELSASAVKTFLSLNLVENTALSTWAGSTNLTTLGTVSTGAIPTTLLTGTVTNAQLAGSIAASKLVGTDIATVGTITAGTWNGTVLAGLYGGTGVANSGKTITLAGNLVTTGAFNTTFAQAATTTVTLPGSSSTMARTDAGQTFTGTQAFGALSASGQFTSTVSTGTAPFVVASTTVVANLNASFLNGATFSAPGSIGNVTPAQGQFTSVVLASGGTAINATNIVTAQFTRPTGGGPAFNLTYGNTTPSDGDGIGSWNFQGYDNTAALKTLVNIAGSTNGANTNNGRVTIKTANAGTLGLAMTLDENLKVTTGAGIQTSTPSGGVVGVWKFGAIRTGVALAPSTTQGVQLDVGGTLVTLATLTTNP